MGYYTQFRDVKPDNTHIWVERINALMQEKKITQQELAARCGLSPSVVSDWIGLNKREGQTLREPKIVGFQRIAKCLDVSVDYLLGENECETPDKEKIHKKLGLSRRAIRNLEKITDRIADENNSKNLEAEKQITVLNFLIESLNRTTLLVNLYDYLLGEFSFPGKEDDYGAAFMVEKLPSGKHRRSLTFKDVFSQAMFVNVQQDLMRLKEKATERYKSSVEERDSR